MRLVLFDMDGTLVDSQAHIVGSMDAAFEALGLSPPTRAQTLAIVGLSLPQAMERLAPGGPRDALVQAYKDAYVALRDSHGERSASPLYAGIRDVLETLHAQPETLLGVATGKSRAGLDHVLGAHDLRRFFVTLQCADDHPSKPHPAMAEAVLADCGLSTGVIVGDTTFDLQMGRAAGMATLGVTWGYHARAQLAPYADALADTVADLPAHLEELHP
ncbi:MAG: HAD-IA family hydrolase [Pseudomonadota bacterium]